MNKIEKRMVQTYWESAGGVLVEEFFVGTTDSGEDITADALIVTEDKQNQYVPESTVRGRDMVTLYVVDGSPSLTMVGKGLVGADLLRKEHGARSVEVVIACTKEDPVIRNFIETSKSARMIVYDPNEISASRSDSQFSTGSESFRFICNLEPLRDFVSSRVREFHPDKEYRGNAPLHKYGTGPFCVFTIPITTSGFSGVYVVVSDNEVVFIGGCDDLYDKFHFQFGHIQPRDCYSGGHPELCRINRLIMNEVKTGHSLKLYFLESESRDALVSELVRTLKPKWNIHGKRAPRQRFPLDVSGLTGLIGRDWGLKGLTPGRRYKDLTEHLKNVDSDEVTMGYDMIELIIKRKLPPSAYKYHAWWSNGNRTQAIAWLAAGWRVKGVDLGKSVIFRRVDR